MAKAYLKKIPREGIIDVGLVPGMSPGHFVVGGVVGENGSDRLAVGAVGAPEEILFGEKRVGARPGRVHEADVAVHVVAHVAQTGDVVDGGRREVDVVGRDHPDSLVVILRPLNLYYYKEKRRLVKKMVFLFLKNTIISIKTKKLMQI